MFLFFCRTLLGFSKQPWALLLHVHSFSFRTLYLCCFVRSILNEYQNTYPNKIRLLNDQKIFSSACKNFFYLIERRSTKANLYCLCDQDDIWHERKLKLIIERYNSIDDEKPLLIHSDLSLIDSSGKILEKSHNKLINFQKNLWICRAYMWKYGYIWFF